MGFRTTVILFNDQAHEWQNDPQLGKKIVMAMNHGIGAYAEIGYGRVVECTHADNQTIGILDSYNFTPLVHSNWRSGESENERNVRLLKELADRLGYRVRRK